MTILSGDVNGDDVADDLQTTILGKLKEQMKGNSESISVALDVFTITRRLERIADLATNISEDIIYMVSGEIVRHVDTSSDES